jgi:hypothetical protein
MADIYQQARQDPTTSEFVDRIRQTQ